MEASINLREKGIRVIRDSRRNVKAPPNPHAAVRTQRNAAKAGACFDGPGIWTIMARYHAHLISDYTGPKLMVTHMFMAAERYHCYDRRLLLILLHSEGDTIILESCEYCNSFLSFLPTVAVILNVDEDHLDFFKDLDDIKRSFRKFAELVPDSGCVIANYDDKNTMSTLEGIGKRVIPCGLSEGADFCADNLNIGKTLSFDVLHKGAFLLHLDLKISGKHNIYNALAAVAAGTELNIAPEFIKSGLESFKGAGRRLEYKRSLNNIDFYDYYEHHQTELNALLQGFKHGL